MVWFARAEQDAARPRAAPDWFDGGALLLTAVFVLVQLLRPLPASLIQTDSPAYLNFASTRTAGYPLFLRVVEHLPGGLHSLPLLQLAIYGLAALFLCGSFRRLSGSKFATAMLLALLLGNGQVTRLSFMIMTELIFLSCLMLLLGIFCRLLRVPRWPTLALASLITGLAVLIRPAGYALVVSLPVVAWWCWRDGLAARQTVLAAAMPYIVVLGSGITAYHAEHGLWRTETFAGRTLLGKAAAVAYAARPEKDDRIIRSIAMAVAPDRAVIAQAPSLFDRFRLMVPYYDIWRYKTAYNALLAQTKIPKGDLAALDQRMAQVSLTTIAAAPSAYLADVALNYGALWALPDAMTHTELAHFRTLLSMLEPLPDLGRYPRWHREHSDVLIWALRGFMLTALAASLWWSWRFVANAIFHSPLPPLARLGFVVGILVHSSFLLTAAVQAAIPRYAWAMWPALSVLFVSAVFVCSDPVQRALAGIGAPRSLSAKLDNSHGAADRSGIIA